MKYEVFLERAKEKHGDKFEYPFFEETSCINKVKVICPIHGEFMQQISVHLRGDGCPKCIGRRNWTTEDFVKAAKEKHGDKFDYSKSVFKDRRTKVCIISKELISEDNPEGMFWQLPFSHIDSPTGMPFRGKRCREYPKLTDKEVIEKKTKEFIEKAKEIYGDKYDVSDAVYTGSLQKVKIICPKHGVFTPTANNFMRGHGCPKCSGNSRLTTEEFIERATKVHNGKYDYSEVVIGNNADCNVDIICPEHGLFSQNAIHHLRGVGCPSCAKNKPLTTEEFIERATKVHNGKYDYSKTIYTRTNEPVIIICPIHGEFTQIANSHLQGQGCPYCNESHAERDIAILLEENNIEFQREKIIDGIKYKCHLPFDFYLPKFNILIECQGAQHFKSVDRFNEPLEERIKKDFIKYNGSKERGITLLYYASERGIKKYLNSDERIKEMYKDNLFFSKEKMLTKIKSLL